MPGNKEGWCPLMQDMCIEGWCSKMDKAKKRGPSPKCRFWVLLQGKHPQEDKFVDDYDCAISWLPLLLTEIGRLENSTGAAVESLRNRVSETKEEIKQLGQKSIIVMKELPPATPAEVIPVSIPQLENKGDQTEGVNT